MPVTCPVCSTESPDGSWECATCGKRLATPSTPSLAVELVEGLEQTCLDSAGADAGEVARLPEVEETQLASRDLDVVVEPIEIERSEIGPAAPAQQFWTEGIEDLETGRETDDLPKTPEPETAAICIWCGAPAPRPVCDNCGRRRNRGRDRVETQEGPAASEGLEQLTMLCPACFSRVPVGDRCEECRSPLPPRELY
jgi:hypothetical protein